jgi:hypothetical protein
MRLPYNSECGDVAAFKTAGVSRIPNNQNFFVSRA